MRVCVLAFEARIGNQTAWTYEIVSCSDFPIPQDGGSIIMSGRRKFFYVYDLEHSALSRGIGIAGPSPLPPSSSNSPQLCSTCSSVPQMYGERAHTGV